MRGAKAPFCYMEGENAMAKKESKTWVKMNVSIAADDFSYVPGQEIEIDSDLAKIWKESGHCEIIESKPDNGELIEQLQKETQSQKELIEQLQKQLEDKTSNSEDVVV